MLAAQQLHDEEAPMGDEVPKPEVRLDPKTIDYLVDRIAAAIAPAVATAVSSSLEQAMTEERAARLFEVGWKTVQKQAQLKAGRWLFGGLRTAAGKAAWVAVFVLSMWISFGTAGLVAAWKALTSGGHP
jgi:hypothetical protein